MKQRRQLAALTLSAAMLISMTACGQGTQPSTSSVPSSSSQPSASQSSSASVPSSPEGESDYPLNNQGGIAAVEGSDIGTAATTLSTRDASGYNGAVTSGKQEASEVGIEVLKAGGNAIDACVATALAIGFFEPNASRRTWPSAVSSLHLRISRWTILSTCSMRTAPATRSFGVSSILPVRRYPL